MTNFDTAADAGFNVVAAYVRQNPDLPILGETGFLSLATTPAYNRTKPYIRLSPTLDDICVSAVTREGVWGERVGRTVAVEYRDRADVAFVLSDQYRANLHSAVETKVAEIAALSVEAA